MRLLPLLAIVLSGCLPALPTPEVAAPGPPFDPVAFFAGRTDGVGTLWIRGQPSRNVAVESVGRRLPDRRLELRQLIRIGDGDPQERTWLLQRTGPTTFGGALTDADGPVEATVEGSRLTIRYPMPGGLRMTQHLTLAPGGQSARNLATVRWRGIPIARLDEIIRRRAPGSLPETGPR